MHDAGGKKEKEMTCHFSVSNFVLSDPASSNEITIIKSGNYVSSPLYLLLEWEKINGNIMGYGIFITQN